MEQGILKDWQKKVIALVASTPELERFYLTGGTALSGYYLQHRVSDDLDFFTEDDIDTLFIEQFAVKIKELLNASKVKSLSVEELKNLFTQEAKKLSSEIIEGQ